MKLRPISFAAVAFSACIAATEPLHLLHPNQVISRPAYPIASDAGYVLLEIWPRVRDITLTAYFLDAMDERSRNFCEVTKKALDSDAKARSNEQQTKFTSYRFCMTIKDAVARGWIKQKD